MADGETALGTVVANTEPVEAPVVDQPTPEADPDLGNQQPTGDENLGTRTEGDEPQEREQPRPDARTLPKDVQKALKAFREANPAYANSARALNDAFFRSQAYESIYPTVEDARVTHATLEAVGGAEGIADMQRKIDVLTELDDGVERGDPTVIDDMKDSPGFKRLVPYALDVLQKMDNEAYGETMKPHFWAALEGAGLKDVLLDSIEELRAGNTDKADRGMKSIIGWLKGVEDGARQLKSARTDPRIGQLEQREKALRDGESSSFRNNVSRDLMTYINPQMQTALDNLWRGYNLPEATKKDIAQGVFNELSAIMGQDKAYKDQAEALLKGRDHNKALNYMKAKVDQSLSKAAREVWNRRYPSGAFSAPAPARRPAAPANGNGAPPTNANGAGASPSNPLKLAARPNLADLDDSADPTQVYFIAHKGRLASGANKGKWVAWPK